MAPSKKIAELVKVSNYLAEKYNIGKPKRTITKYKIEPEPAWVQKKYESFDEYASKLGVGNLVKKKRKKRKNKITVEGCNRIRIPKEPPKPKRMIRIETRNGKSL